jgi:hypothetical protein
MEWNMLVEHVDGCFTVEYDHRNFEQKSHHYGYKHSVNCWRYWQICKYELPSYPQQNDNDVVIVAIVSTTYTATIACMQDENIIIDEVEWDCAKLCSEWVRFSFAYMYAYNRNVDGYWKMKEKENYVIYNWISCTHTHSHSSIIIVVFIIV